MLYFPSGTNSEFKLTRITPPQELKPNVYSFLYPSNSHVICRGNLLISAYNKKYSLGLSFENFSLHGCLVPSDGIIFDGNIIMSIKHKRFMNSDFKDLVVPSKYSFCSSPSNRMPYNLKDFYKVGKCYVKKNIVSNLLQLNNLYNISSKGLVISEHPFKCVKTQFNSNQLEHITLQSCAPNILEYNNQKEN